MGALVEQFAQRYPEAFAGRWVLSGLLLLAPQLPCSSTLTGKAKRNDCLTALFWRVLLPYALTTKKTAVPADALVIHGENDDVVALEEVMQWARPIDMPVVVIPSAGHFFHGKLLVLRQLVQTRLKSL